MGKLCLSFEQDDLDKVIYRFEELLLNEIFQRNLMGKKENFINLADLNNADNKNIYGYGWKFYGDSQEISEMRVLALVNNDDNLAVLMEDPYKCDDSFYTDEDIQGMIDEELSDDSEEHSYCLINIKDMEDNFGYFTIINLLKQLEQFEIC